MHRATLGTFESFREMNADVPQSQRKATMTSVLIREGVLD
jgi:hypothetical protein